MENLPFESIQQSLGDKNYLLGILLLPLFWTALYYLLGFYKDLYRKSRLSELNKTFLTTLFGVVLIFFVLILDDEVPDYRSYYRSFSFLATVHFALTFGFRLFILNKTKRQIQHGHVGFNTLMIGGNMKALELYNELTGKSRSYGYRFKGFLNSNGVRRSELGEHLPNLGTLENMHQVIKEQEIEEVIIAVETSEHPKLSKILNALADTAVKIKIIPDMYDIVSGSVKMQHILGAILIEVDQDLMPTWQKVVKRSIDVVASSVFILLFSWLYVFAAIRVKMSSPGPIFYAQDRIGLHGQPFRINKFRSMFVDAEQDGPALSSGDDDPRITKWGKVMRKWRIDEIPQFWNVLIGEMSLVGPRPERKFYIDQIVKKAPHYSHLQKVQPGITSWGMVQYGYAENVDQMIERLKYDVLYIENMSLAVDFKIMLYTVKTILQGRGQ